MTASEVVMKRDDPNIAWGFRLTGGADLGTPFYVVKVLGRGHAERAGLQVGDMVYAINGKYINNFTHKDAQNAILHTGHTLILNIRRGPFSGRGTPLPEYADPLMGLAPAPETPRPTLVPLPPYQPPPIITKEPSPPESEGEEEGEDTVAAFNVKINPKGRIAAIEELPVTPPPTRSPSRSRSRSRSRDRRASSKRVSMTSQQPEEETRTNGASGPGESFTYSKEVVTQYSTILSASEQTEGQVSELINESFIIHGGSEHKMEDILSPEDIERDIFEEKMEEQKLTELLTGEAEILDKGVVGINFQKIIPKTGFIKESHVFKGLQEECLKKEESEEEQLRKDPNKRFSTFLQTPKRPIPKPKPRAYPSTEDTLNPETPNQAPRGPQIIQQQMQTVQQHEETSTQSSTTTWTENVNIIEGVSFQEVRQTQDEREHEERMMGVAEAGPIITEAISNENIYNEKVRFRDGQEDEDKENQCSIEEYKEQVNMEEQTSLAEAVQEEKPIEKQYQSEFERQLGEIQKQLESIQQLPNVLQANLTALQDQLMKIVQAKTAADQKEEEKTTSPKKSEQSQNGSQSNLNWEIDVTVEENIENVKEEIQEENLKMTIEQETEETNNTETQPEDKEVADSLINELNEHFENMKNQHIRHQEDEELSMSKPPIIRNFPRSQVERPIVLPGGRKWYKPKDAYNEDFIAETIIHQSEVLVGSTIGLNFCKYEPPKFDAKNSAVYRLVQELEKRTECGPVLPIEVRPEKVLAEEDYFPPISKRHFFAARLSEQTNENVEKILQDSSGQDIISV